MTEAIQDFSCRLSVQEDTSVACTRNRIGAYAYFSPTSRKQFCYQVPETTAFEFGVDTIVAASRLKDLAGNLGSEERVRRSRRSLIQRSP